MNLNKFFISLILVVASVLASLQAQDVTIKCYFEKVDTNYCNTCVDLKSYEIFTGIKVEFPDSTYKLYAPYRVFDEDTFFVIQDIYNTLIYIGENRVTYANKFEMASAISTCLSDTSGASGTTVVASYDSGSGILTVNVNGVIDTALIPASGSGCCDCDSILFFKNDSIAALNGINRYGHYLTSAGNSYGMAWGMVKVESEYYPTSGVLAAGCISNYPDIMQYYKSDSEAKTTGGLIVGKYYLLDSDNLYAMSLGTIKRITE